MEAEVSFGEIRGRLKLDLRVPIATLEPCKAKVIPQWNPRGLKNEKWVVHLHHDGKVRQTKIGDNNSQHE